MAVLTSDRKITKGGKFGGLGHGPVLADTVIPDGRPVFTDATTGLLTNTSNAGANKFAGFSHHRVDNTGGIDGEKDSEYWIEDRFEHPFNALTHADVGKKVYAVDNDEFTLTAAGASYVGTLTEFIDTDKGEVDVDTQAV